MSFDSNKFTRPWETNEWKKIRNKLLKTFCEECGSTNTILVLKQNWKFPRYSQIVKNTRNELINELISKNLISEFHLSNEESNKFIIYKCPKCQSGSIRERKQKLPKFSCSWCKFEFQEPIKIIDFNDYRIKSLEASFYNNQLEKYQIELEFKIKKKQEYYNVKYLSGEFTRTLCKRCAFALDKGKVLCKNCKKNYHSIRYERCFICNSKPCSECNKNRILLTSDKSICEECDQKLTETRICIICKKNEIDRSSNLKLCDHCILDGHWVD